MDVDEEGCGREEDGRREHSLEERRGGDKEREREEKKKEEETGFLVKAMRVLEKLREKVKGKVLYRKEEGGGKGTPGNTGVWVNEGKVEDDFKVWDWGEMLGVGKEVGMRRVRERKVVIRDGVHLERNWNQRMAANNCCRIAGDL